MLIAVVFNTWVHLVFDELSWFFLIHHLGLDDNKDISERDGSISLSFSKNIINPFIILSILHNHHPVIIMINYHLHYQ